MRRRHAERRAPTDAPGEPRASLLWPSVALWVGFVALLVVGVVTVAVPSLRDDAEPEAPAQSSDTDEAPAEGGGDPQASDPAPSAKGTTAQPPDASAPTAPEGAASASLQDPAREP